MFLGDGKIVSIAVRSDDSNGAIFVNCPRDTNCHDKRNDGTDEGALKIAREERRISLCSRANLVEGAVL